MLCPASIMDSTYNKQHGKLSFKTNEPTSTWRLQSAGLLAGASAAFLLPVRRQRQRSSQFRMPPSFQSATFSWHFERKCRIHQKIWSARRQEELQAGPRCVLHIQSRPGESDCKRVRPLPPQVSIAFLVIASHFPALHSQACPKVGWRQWHPLRYSFQGQPW